MANRYWIGDGGAITDTAHWSDTSGGSGGFSEPTSADAVFFDANSFTTGSQTVTGSLTCLSVDFTGVTNTPYFNAHIGSYGNITYVAGMTVNASQELYIYDNCTLNTAGLTIGYILSQTNAVSYTLDLASNLVVTNTVNFDKCNFTTNNYDMTVGGWVDGSFHSKTATLGSSIITIVKGTCWLKGSVVAGTSKIIMNHYSVTTATFGVKSSQAYYDVEFNCQNITIGYTSATSWSCRNLDINAYNDTNLVKITTEVNITGTLNIDGNASYDRVVESTGLYNNVILEVDSDATLNYCSLERITGTGTGTIYAVNSTDAGDNIDIVFGSPPSSNSLAYYNGSAWVSGILKYYNGSAWVEKTLKRWNGSAWV